ncbi:HD family phosphohydrolase [Mycolicibacterium fluoranthenivorans]|uniref:Putative HD phosphohydrolase n=1 Tax=Mycolicibacterium fluoranthenivorans TaxID=258505 RepID=A0A7X5R5C2_9MYCO|nr:HD family phosphohydrolase [Mycolicibacterium fluoranthenivorans]MCV7359351.1 HD family phosphohydrolase [Mycolicibacterium fluoranthenivorans]NIH93560.1 putative HD phosphohydrolase [Mycolicibacterium fluoranthenivorans]
MRVLDETTLEELHTVLRSLRGVWDEESVDELDHALQSAAKAIEDTADDELVLAAALHDLGHSPLIDAGPEHDAVARAWLTPRFGERVGWLAGAHVAAKRYLAATDTGYTPSQVSVLSLARQGGPGVDPAFVTHPWWPDALRLRRYDDAAKDPGARGATIEDVLTVARRVLHR